RAFRGGSGRRGIPVAHRWETIGRRTVLVERIQFARARPELLTLPALGTSTNAPGATNASLSRASRWLAQGSLPAAPPLVSAKASKPIQRLAALSTQNDFCMDYEVVEEGGGYYFWCGWTYWVQSPCYISYGDIEPGTCIKYSDNASLQFNNWLHYADYGD